MGDTRTDRPIGRDREIALILDELDSSGACYLTGPAGVGKSMILRELRRQLGEAGVQVIAISGMEATALVPLAPLLRFCPPGADDAGAAIIAELYRLSRSSKVVITVDDAHLLDDATAAIVRQLAGVEIIGLLIAQRDGEEVPAAVRSIKDEEVARHVPLLALDREATADLTERILGETASGTIDWIWDHGQGNPLYTRELIAAGTQTGALELRDGRWAAVEAPIWTSRLHSLVARRLADLAPDERACLQMVAIAGRLHPDILGRFFDLDTILELEGRNLLRREEQSVEMDHPLYGTALLSMMSETQTRAAALQVAEALESSESHRDPVVIASLRLDAGIDVEESLLWEALRAARDSRLPKRAERFALRLLEMGDEPEVRMYLCEALALQGHWDEAEQEYKAATAVAETRDHAALLERWVFVNFEFRDDVTEAARIVREASPQLEYEGSENWEIALLRIGLFTGNLDASVEAHQAWLAEHPESQLRPLVFVGLATACSHNGAFAVGLESSQQMGRPPGLDPVEQARIDGVTLQNQAWLHGLEATRSLFEETFRRDVESGDPERELLARIYHGMVNNDLTCTMEAVHHLRETASMEQYARRRRASPIIPGELARAVAGMDGGEDEARRLLSDFYSFPTEVLWLSLPVAKIAEAILAEREGSDPFPFIAEGLDHSRRRSARIHEVSVLRVTAQLGRADETTDRLEELTRYMGGGFAGLVTREAEGLANHDPGLLDDVAADAWRFGAIGLASDAAAWAAGFHAARDDLREALLSQMRSDAIVVGQPVRTVARDRLERVVTKREQEVVEAVSSGASNRDVADRLFISHRTVESHLRRIYRRFGIDGREELTRLVRQAVTRPPLSS